jgi:hypothetical protein
MIYKVRLAASLPVLMAVAACGLAAQTFALDSIKGLQTHDVTVEAVTYLGRKAVRVTPMVAADAEAAVRKDDEGGGIAVLIGAITGVRLNFAGTQ